MIALIQRVNRGSVEVDGKPVAEIGKGFVVLVGVCKDDKSSNAIKLADKVAGLRVFGDENGKMNLDIFQVKGEILAVSQFTLCADTVKGRRPSFDGAMKPEFAKTLFDGFVELLRAKGIPTKTGIFGAYMQVKIENDGPVTLIVTS